MTNFNTFFLFSQTLYNPMKVNEGNLIVFTPGEHNLVRDVFDHHEKRRRR